MRSCFRNSLRERAVGKRTRFSIYSQVTGSPGPRPQFTHVSEPGAVATGPILNPLSASSWPEIELQSTLLS